MGSPLRPVALCPFAEETVFCPFPLFLAPALPPPLGVAYYN